MRLLLASASPRRRELLAAAGWAFDVDAVEIDERPRPGETPAAYVERNAREKVRAALARHPARVVVGADTTVVVDGEVLGKPADEADAARMLRRLANRIHDVLTGVAVSCQGRTASAVESTRVWVGPLTDEDIAAYVRSGEPMDKAGAYAIQGRASGFIPRIEGSYTNVVGLPVATLGQLLRDVGAVLPYPDGVRLRA